MNAFKLRRFHALVILQCVRWYCRYGISYRDTVRHRTSKYLNNRIEADHGPVKRLCRATLGFQSMKTEFYGLCGIQPAAVSITATPF